MSEIEDRFDHAHRLGVEALAHAEMLRKEMFSAGCLTTASSSAATSSLTADTLKETIKRAEAIIREAVKPFMSAMVNNAMFSCGPLRLFVSPYAVQRRQYRFPKSKGRRIRKKWSKRPENWRDEPAAYLIKSPLPFGGTIDESMVLHPGLAAMIKL